VDFGDFDGLASPLARSLQRWLSWFHVAPRTELLRQLEDEATRHSAHVQTLPGRYAFRASFSNPA
jgi:hypothetical protein